MKRLTAQDLETAVNYLNQSFTDRARTGIVQYQIGSEGGYTRLVKYIDGDYSGLVEAGTKREIFNYINAMRHALHSMSDATYLQAKKDSKA